MPQDLTKSHPLHTTAAWMEALLLSSQVVTKVNRLSWPKAEEGPSQCKKESQVALQSWDFEASGAWRFPSNFKSEINLIWTSVFLSVLIFQRSPSHFENVLKLFWMTGGREKICCALEQHCTKWWALVICATFGAFAIERNASHITNKGAYRGGGRTTKHAPENGVWWEGAPKRLVHLHIFAVGALHSKSWAQNVFYLVLNNTGLLRRGTPSQVLGYGCAFGICHPIPEFHQNLKMNSPDSYDSLWC